MKACPRCGKKFIGGEEFCPTDGVALVDLDDIASDGDPLIGTTLDNRYTVESKLGEGGMGVVYRATHAVIGKSCAIKVLRSDLSAEQEVSERFIQEARAAAAIGNEHIIEITDFGQLQDGSSYFVMEMLDGQTLHGALENAQQLEIERVLHIIEQCCDALSAAHSANIVHRDLKPENIFLIERHKDPDFVKILDFGIAKMARETGRLTRTGMVFGTPQYMSPEQAAGSNLDHRTDIYSLGIIMYEMMCGHVPFEADTFMGVLTKHLYEEPIPPKRLVPPVKIPSALEAVLLKSIAKKPEKRYQSMSEFGEDLRSVIAGKTPTLVFEQMRETAGTTLPPVPPSEIVGSSPRNDTAAIEQELKKSNRLPLILGIAAAVLVLAVAAVFLLGTEDKQSAAAEPVVVATQAPTATPTESAAETQSAAKTGKVTIDAQPKGARLYKGDALLGELPFEVSKPAENAGNDRYKVKLDGFRDMDVIVMNTSPTELKIRLEKSKAEPETTAVEDADGRSSSKKSSSRKSSKRRSSRKKRAEKDDPPDTTAAPPKRKPKKKKQISGDLADPWAN